MTTIFIHLTFIPILLVLAGLLAASEAALFSLSPAQLEALQERFPWVYHRIKNLLATPEALLSTFVIANEFVTISIGTLVTGVIKFSFFWEERWILLASILTTASLLLLISEILPKVIAFRFPTLVAGLVVFPISWVNTLLTPIRKILLFITKFLFQNALLAKSSPARTVDEEEFRVLVEVGEQSGSIERNEKDLILNVLDLSDLTVASILTPWNRVFAIEEGISVDALIASIRENPYSRIPVLSKDNTVVGILHVKELTKLMIQDSKSFSIQKALSKPFVTPLHKKVSTLFRDFQTRKVHLALVVDEFGKNIGVVTLDDILNAIFKLRTSSQGKV